MEIKMIWDFICMSKWVWTLKKLWSYRNWVFRVKRKPELHTMHKLDAYGFNAECLNMIYKANKNAIIEVNQYNTLYSLRITLQKALEVWVYLVFNWEKQIFIKKKDFDKFI